MKHENLHLTTAFYFVLDTQQKQSNGSSTESHKNLEKSRQSAQAAGIVSIVILIGLLAVLACWLRRRRSSKLVSYTGNEALHLHDEIWIIIFHLPKYLVPSSALLEGTSKLPAHNSGKSCCYQKPRVPWGGHSVPEHVILYGFLLGHLTLCWFRPQFLSCDPYRLFLEGMLSTSVPRTSQWLAGQLRVQDRTGIKQLSTSQK